MRVLRFNVCILLVAIAVIQGVSLDDGSVMYPPEPVSAKCGRFFDYVEPPAHKNESIDTAADQPVDPPAHKNESSATAADQPVGSKDPKYKNRDNFLKLMKKRFDLSLEYLLTSKQFGSQFVERPGLAKYLDESSSRQWEEGMDVLKKYLQRGGSINNKEFSDAMNVGGAGQLTLAEDEKLVKKYIDTLDGMRKDSLGLANDMNALHHVAGRVPRKGGDADIAHYLDGKLEKEAVVIRELARYVNNLRLMSSSGIAVNMFDSNF